MLRKLSFYITILTLIVSCTSESELDEISRPTFTEFAELNGHSRTQNSDGWEIVLKNEEFETLLQSYTDTYNIEFHPGEGNSKMQSARTSESTCEWIITDDGVCKQSLMVCWRETDDGLEWGVYEVFSCDYGEL